MNGATVVPGPQARADVRVQWFRRLSTGPLVVLAHGLEDNWTSWNGLCELLDPGWSIAVLDLPWRAGNDYGWRSRSPARWLADGLAQFDRPPAAVIAHSFGANAMLNLAAARATVLPRAVVAICPLHRRPELPVTWSMFDRAKRAFDQHIRDGLQMRMAARSRALDPEILDAMLLRAMDRIGPAGFLTVFGEFIDSAVVPLDRIDLDVLLMAGGSDPTLDHVSALSLAASTSRCELAFEPSHDHFCHIVRPQDLAPRITEFITGALRPRTDEGALP